MSTYKLSKKSLDKLQGVHPDLVKVIQRAIQLTEVDFGITEGVRTRERQEELFKSGKSQTMNSRHLTGKAVDVVAYKGTEISWDLKMYCKIADAFQKACKELGIPMIWGSCWDRGLLEFSKSSEEEMKDYVERREKLGRKAFLDGPHFELDKRIYP